MPSDGRSRDLPVELVELGAKLRARRTELGLGLQHVAPHGDHTHLSRVERGLDWPSRDLIVHLEQVLAVPRGSYLQEFIERCEPQRHSVQAGYRRSGRPTAGLASAETPLFLNDESGQRLRRLVPPVVPEYRADEPRPFRIVSQVLDQAIDVDGRAVRTTRQWTIQAARGIVKLFDFVLTPPVGRLIDHLEVAILDGGDLERVERHGSNIFHYWLRLLKPLGSRKQVTIMVADGIHGMTYRPAYFDNTVYEKVAHVQLIVRFANQQPRMIWRFDALPHEGIPGLPSAERTLPLTLDSEAKCEIVPAIGLSHGIGWLW